MFSSLRVFGVPNPLPFDITELVLVVLALLMLYMDQKI
jgi:hypothetical protein